MSEMVEDARLFTGMRSNALYEEHMQSVSKVAWIDTPTSLDWFFSMHWAGPMYLTPKFIAEYIVDNEVELPRVKAAFSFLAQHSTHSFTHYESDGVMRMRMAKKPYEMVVLGWNKRGISSVIQENECYISKKMEKGGLGRVLDMVFTLLPTLRMEAIEKEDILMLESLQGRKTDIRHMLTRIEGVSIDMDEVIKSAIDDALSIKFAGNWLAEILTGTHTYGSVNVLETQAPGTIIAEFNKWFAEHAAHDHDFIIGENAILSKTTIGEIKALMAECVLGLGLLKEKSDALYTQYGLTPQPHDEDDEHE